MPPEARSALVNMDFHLQRLNKLVASLLDISQLESGKIPITMEEVDLSRLIRDVVGNFQEYLRRENCSLELALEDSVRVQGNQYRLEQVITNLLMNAVKYGPGKPLRISLKTLDQKILNKNTQGLGLGL